MEQLLHYVWKHKIFPLHELQTTTGLPVEVIDTGLPNSDSGPDFFNAKLKIGGTLWVGNVEIHTASSDWFRHGHDRDIASAHCHRDRLRDISFQWGTGSATPVTLPRTGERAL